MTYTDPAPADLLDTIAEAITEALNPNYPPLERVGHWRTADSSAFMLRDLIRGGAAEPEHRGDVARMVAWTYYSGAIRVN